MLLVDRVSAGYGKARVLEDVTVQVGPSEILAILGPNGSGKSTLLKTVMGLTSLYEGKIVWENKDITEYPVHIRTHLGLGYVPQTHAVFSGLSVLENLSMGMRLASARIAQDELDHVFGLFPMLRERRTLRASALSGGERRLLSLAATLVMHPKCLLLDEPTSAVAPVFITTLFDKVREVVHEYRIPVLLVEQNVRQALGIATRVCVLTRGRVRLESEAGAVNEEILADLFLRA